MSVLDACFGCLSWWTEKARIKLGAYTFLNPDAATLEVMETHREIQSCEEAEGSPMLPQAYTYEYVGARGDAGDHTIADVERDMYICEDDKRHVGTERDNFSSDQSSE